MKLPDSIVFINRVYPPDPGATGRVLRDLAGQFVAAGWRVSVLACGAAEGSADDDGVTVLRIAAPAGRDVAASARQLAALAGGLRRWPAVCGACRWRTLR